MFDRLRKCDCGDPRRGNNGMKCNDLASRTLDSSPALMPALIGCRIGNLYPVENGTPGVSETSISHLALIGCQGIL
jgi:hypothetical protein